MGTSTIKRQEELIATRTMPSNANWNDYRTDAHVGVWTYGDKTNMSNCPNINWGILIVTNAGFPVQTVLRGGQIWMRNYSGSPVAWSKWYLANKF